MATRIRPKKSGYTQLLTAGIPLISMLLGGLYVLSSFMETHYEVKDKKNNSTSTRWWFLTLPSFNESPTLLINSTHVPTKQPGNLIWKKSTIEWWNNLILQIINWVVFHDQKTLKSYQIKIPKWMHQLLLYLHHQPKKEDGGGSLLNNLSNHNKPKSPTRQVYRHLFLLASLSIP